MARCQALRRPGAVSVLRVCGLPAVVEVAGMGLVRAYCAACLCQREGGHYVRIGGQLLRWVFWVTDAPVVQ